MIRLVRVDHRLLHGQVAFSWTRSLGTDCILIASDKVANDEIHASALKLSKPSGIKMVIKGIEDSAKAINSGVTDKYKLMIILGSIADAYMLCKKVSAIKSINLGGVKSEPGKVQISKAVFVNEEEKKMIRELDSMGIEVEVRMLPDETSIKAISLI
ncbi:PTS sugar transporter subunit IIB [uncultured Traorella sp.]|uniref:PTS sugar transporter subunit IIB n=1 Tax=uncultured Traorella sp. TaxID=1929048 RepID=UPI002600C2BC|nr:PTS sugar transporter subunit IIB [uncultured Traorella sp.]